MFQISTKKPKSKKPKISKKEKRKSKSISLSGLPSQGKRKPIQKKKKIFTKSTHYQSNTKSKSLLNIQSHSSAVIADDDDDKDDSQLIPVRVKFEDSNTSGNGIHIGPQNIPVELVTCSGTKRKRGRPRKENSGSTPIWVSDLGLNVDRVLGREIREKIRFGER